MNFGTSLHRGEGIETWLKQTFNFGAKPHDIPTFGFGDAATASICNKSDFVCDFNFFTAIHWARGFRVHTSYAVRQPDGRYTYQKVLTRASDAVGKGLIYLLTHYSYTCS
jgi:hypothetical protein